MKKENECDIVQDLLLSHLDGVLTNTSKELVEKHLRQCEKCQKRFNYIKEDIEQEKVNQDEEVDYLKKVKKKISKRNKLIIVGTIILVIFIIINIQVFTNYNKIASQMEIFLLDSVTQEELEKIEQTIKAEDENAEIIYKSKEDSLEKMREKFKENGNILNGFEGEKNPFSASYIVKSNVKAIKNMQYDLLSAKGIKTVITNIDSNPYLLWLIGDRYT